MPQIRTFLLGISLCLAVAATACQAPQRGADSSLEPRLANLEQQVSQLQNQLAAEQRQVDQLNANLSTLERLRDLLEKMANAPATDGTPRAGETVEFPLTIYAQPRTDEADVFLDGQLKGTTPYTVSAPAGPHTLGLQWRGTGRRSERTVTFGSNVRELVVSRE